MKKISLPFIALILSSSIYQPLASDELDLEIGGKFDFQSAMRAHNNFKEDEDKTKFNLSNNQNRFAYSTKSEITVDASKELESGLSYGAKIAIQPSTSPSMNNSYLYMKYKLGTLHYGTNSDAMTSLSKTAFNLTRSASWSGYAVLDPNKRDIEYITAPGFVSDELSLPSSQAEKARKVTYYTPEYNGFQAGISYIPDTQNVGNKSPKNKLLEKPENNSKKASDKTNSERDPKFDKKNGEIGPQGTYPVINAVSGGVNYKYQTENDLGIELAITGEYGSSVYKEREDLLSYNLGGILSYKGLSCGISFTDWRNSLLLKEASDKYSSYIITAGAGYETGPFGAGIVYLHSDRYGNKLNGVNVSLDYKMAPQLTSYFEFTYFSTSVGNQSMFEVNRNEEDKKEEEKLGKEPDRKGSIIVLGTKLNLD